MRSVRQRLRELVAEDRPCLDDDAEQIGAHGVAVAILFRGRDCEKIGHPEIGEQHADVEGHRPVEGEFRIDDARLVVGDHDRAGMQVAMHQRLGIGGENMLQPLRLDLEVAVGAQFGDDAVELRRGVAVHRRFEIGIGEDQALGDVAKLDIVGEQREVVLARSASSCERSEPRNSVRAMNRPRSLAIFGSMPALDQRAAQDDVRRQILHDDERLRLVEMVDRRHRARRRARSCRVSAWYSKKERFSGSGQLSPTRRT